MPLPPGRFSTSTVWPRMPEVICAILRRWRSVPPPAGRGTSGPSNAGPRPGGLNSGKRVGKATAKDLKAKKDFFASLKNFFPENPMLLPNLWSFLVTAMAAACKRPGRVAGYHFFNPVPVMRIVEVVDGVLTEPWVTDALTALAQRFGHTAVRCKDTPGFIVNHAGRAFVPESLRVLSEGVADFATIDRILIDAAGFCIGPFGLMDPLGLDVPPPLMKSMYPQYFDEPQYR